MKLNTSFIHSRLNIMKVVSQICDEFFIANDVFDHFPDNYSDPAILTIFKNIMPKFEDTMVFCKLFDKWTDCKKFLYPMVTEDGLCYTFNALSIHEVVTNE